MKISQTTNAVDAEQDDFHYLRLAPIVRRPIATSISGEVGANGIELTGRHAALFERGHPLTDVGGRARRLVEAVLLEVVGMFVGAVGQFVADRFGVRPEPGNRPEQPAEDERQQAQRLDRLELRMMPLVRDLLRAARAPSRTPRSAPPARTSGRRSRPTSPRCLRASGDSSEACASRRGRPVTTGRRAGPRRCARGARRLVASLERTRESESCWINL